ncbi:hypothetical protein FOL46_006706, partial [Perkinsus olseni]
LSPMWEPDWFVTEIIGDHDPVKVVRIYHLPTKRSKVYSVDHLKIDPLQPDNLDEIKEQFPPILVRPRPVPTEHGSAQVSTVDEDRPREFPEMVFLGENDDPFAPDQPARGPEWPGMEAFRPQPTTPTPPPMRPAMVKIHLPVDTANRPGILGRAPTDCVPEELQSVRSDGSVRHYRVYSFADITVGFFASSCPKRPRYYASPDLCNLVSVPVGA